MDIIDEFLNCFSKNEQEYCVYLPINSIKQKNELDPFNIFTIAENIYEMFLPSIPYILKYKCSACDPYQAREMTLSLINFALSVNQFIAHTTYSYQAKYADVVNLATNQVTFIKRPQSAIVSGYTDCGDLSVKDLLKSCLDLHPSMLQVLELHSSALISKDSSNQLINLWTALEVVIPVARKGSLCRINQICNALTAMLCKGYFMALTHQLYSDLI